MNETGQAIKNYLYKFLVMLVIMAIIIPLVPNISSAESTYTVDGVTVSLSDDGTMTISGEGEVTEKLTELFEEESNNFENVKKVIINEGITGIGSRTFKYFDKMSSIQMPQSLDWIGQNAFYGCSSLKNIEIPAGVSDI